MHTNEDELRLYLKGEASPERSAFIRSHVTTCHNCGNELARALREYCKSDDERGLRPDTNTEDVGPELYPSVSRSISRQRIRGSKQLSFRLTQGEYEDLLRISEERMVRVSDLARGAVQDLLPRTRQPKKTDGLTEKVRTLDGRVEELNRKVKFLVALLIGNGAVSAQDLESMIVACGSAADGGVANEGTAALKTGGPGHVER